MKNHTRNRVTFIKKNRQKNETHSSADGIWNEIQPTADPTPRNTRPGTETEFVADNTQTADRTSTRKVDWPNRDRLNGHRRRVGRFQRTSPAVLTLFTCASSTNNGFWFSRFKSDVGGGWGGGVVVRLADTGVQNVRTNNGAMFLRPESGQLGVRRRPWRANTSFEIRAQTLLSRKSSEARGGEKQK